MFFFLEKLIFYWNKIEAFSDPIQDSTFQHIDLKTRGDILVNCIKRFEKDGVDNNNWNTPASNGDFGGHFFVSGPNWSSFWSCTSLQILAWIGQISFDGQSCALPRIDKKTKSSGIFKVFKHIWTKSLYNNLLAAEQFRPKIFWIFYPRGPRLYVRTTQRGSKFCFVVLVLVAANLLRILYFRPISPCFQLLSILCHCMHVTLPNSLAQQPCPAALPGSLARQPCPAALPGSLARQPCPADLAGSQIQLKILHFCPSSPCFQASAYCTIAWTLAM
jgi:hypothetical protein